MTRARRLMLVPVAGVTAALLWTSVGTFSSASGQTPSPTAALIRRAHEGSHAPAFDKPIFFLILGGDARVGNPSSTLMDSIHIVAVDPTSSPIRASILGIPRDSYVEVPGRGRDKITHAGRGGADLMIRTVENLSGCKFDYYLQTSFEGIRGKRSDRRNTGIINEIGGVRFKVERTYPAAPVIVEKGTQVLNGNEFLSYARNRKQRARGDFDRTKAQGALMIGVLREVQRDVEANPGAALRVLGAVRRNVRMNISISESINLGLLAMRLRPKNVKNIDVNGRIGSAGSASIVVITKKGRAQMVDVCSDGNLDS